MKMLIVDDDPMILTFLSHVAKLSGYDDVITAASGTEALGKVVRDDYDLVTLDIEMPGVSGLGILSLIRNLCPHAVIVIVSGHIPEQELPNVINCADLALNKPIDMDVMKDLMDRTDEMTRMLKRIQAMGDVILRSNTRSIPV